MPAQITTKLCQKTKTFKHMHNPIRIRLLKVLVIKVTMICLEKKTP